MFDNTSVSFAMSEGVARPPLPRAAASGWMERVDSLAGIMLRWIQPTAKQDSIDLSMSGPSTCLL